MRDGAADVSMYSFGTLKTSTALGGAVLRVRDREVLERMRGIQASYPPQGWGGYSKKLLGVLGLVAVSYRGSWISSGRRTPWGGLWRVEGTKGGLEFASRGDAGVACASLRAARL